MGNSVRNLFLLILLSFSLFSCGQAIPITPKHLVTDEAQVLSEDQRNELETKLVAFSNFNGTQIVVLTQNGIKRELNEYCTEIMNTWGIGQAHRNNGVLLFIDPQEHNTYLATGTGTEVWLPNNKAKQIIDNQLIPAFKEGNYYKGTQDALKVIMDLADKAYPSTK